MIKLGERAAWPEVERIRIQTKISRTLDKIIEDIEKELVQDTPLCGRRRRAK
jgi:hypothetical protein